MSWDHTNFSNNEQKKCADIYELLQDPRRLTDLMKGGNEGKVKGMFTELLRGLDKSYTHVGFCAVRVTERHKFVNNLQKEHIWYFAERNEGTHTETLCAIQILKKLNALLNTQILYSLVLSSGFDKAEIVKAHKAVESACVKRGYKYRVSGIEIIWVLQKNPCPSDCMALVTERLPRFVAEVFECELNFNYWSAGF